MKWRRRVGETTVHVSQAVALETATFAVTRAVGGVREVTRITVEYGDGSWVTLEPIEDE